MSVNVPSGYKQTKVGVIPEDWDVVKIKDVTDYVDYRGKTPKKVENGILLVTARNIKQGYLDYETSKEYIAKDDYLNVMSRGVPKIGDVLLTTEAPLGNIAQIDNENIALAQRVIKFRAEDDLDNTYLKYHFLSNKFQAYLLRLAIGTTVLGIQGKQLHKMLIPLPALKEQQKIAQILSTLDNAISKQEALIKAKEELKKGLMQKLLSGEVRFGGFDGEWEEVRLGDMAKINPKNNTLPESFVYIDLESVTNGILLKESMIYRDDAPSRAQRLLKQDDILYQTVRPYQKNNFFFDLNGNYVASTGYAQIRALESSKYLYHYLHWDVFVSKVLLKCTGTSYPAINSTDLGKIKIKFPAKEEQEKIAEILTLSDKEIELLKKELEALKEQKRGLMQKLLSGEVRTNNIKEKECK